MREHTNTVPVLHAALALEHHAVDLRQLLVELDERLVLGSIVGRLDLDQDGVDLVDVPVHSAAQRDGQSRSRSNRPIKDGGHKQRLNVSGRDIELVGDKGEPHAGVWLDQLQHHLRPDVVQQLCRA